MDRRTHGTKDIWNEGYMERRIHGTKDTWNEGYMERRIHGTKETRIEGYMERRIDGNECVFCGPVNVYQLITFTVRALAVPERTSGSDGLLLRRHVCLSSDKLDPWCLKLGSYTTTEQRHCFSHTQVNNCIPQAMCANNYVYLQAFGMTHQVMFDSSR